MNPLAHRLVVPFPPACTCSLVSFTAMFLGAWSDARADAPQMPAGFFLEAIGSDWGLPTGLAFLDQTRLLVCEKAGLVWLVENDVKKNVVLDLRVETLSNGDRGIVGIAIDPEFAANGHLYLLLTVDPDRNGIDSDQEAFARVDRYTTAFDAAGNLYADESSRVTLLGDTWSTGIPSCNSAHAVGAIRFLSDGSLVLSHGDGAPPAGTDSGGQYADCFGPGKTSPDQDVGAFRSVHEGSFDGKILRIDPATGLGLPDNPFFDGDPSSISSRIYAMGLRNPYRLAVIPGTGPRDVLAIGDVGWNAWEEVDLAYGGENFGWPCYEGPYAQSAYQGVDIHGFCPGVSASHVLPLLTWHHSDTSHAGFSGQCAGGIAVYPGGEYPPVYAGALFFTDYVEGWLKVAFLDPDLQLLGVTPFGTSMDAPVDLVAEPGTGDLVYIGLGHPRTVSRIRYSGLNQPPTAVAIATPAWGKAPLDVKLSGSRSSDPEQDSLVFSWDLGDGTSSDLAALDHVYPDASIDYRPRLRVTDALGYESVTEILITPGNTPPSIDAIEAPVEGELYDVGTAFELDAVVSDAEDDAAGGGTAVIWHIDLIHDHHEHPDHAVATGEHASIVPDVPYEGTYFRVRLEVQDGRGLRVEESILIYDSQTMPEAHLVGTSDVAPRANQSVQMTGHMELPGNLDGGHVPTLIWDWGDGTRQVFGPVAHQKDSTPTHVYTQPGTYTVELTAQLGPHSSTAEQTLTVLPPRTAIAVFVPLIVERWIDSEEQQAIANGIAAATTAADHESAVFAFNEQAELAQWMSAYLDDGVHDVVVILDLVPASVYRGENDGSLAERWLEAGNGILWTGATPFSEYVLENGTTSNQDAGIGAAAEILDSAYPSLVSGFGFQELEPAAAQVPSLEPFQAFGAVRYDRLGSEWKVHRLYATDADQDSDALAIRHDSGGVYAQLYSTSGSFPREEVLVEFLKALYFAPGEQSKKR